MKRQSICHWFLTEFNNSNSTFINPAHCQFKYESTSPLLQASPNLSSAFPTYCEANLATLNAEVAKDYLITTAIPAIFKTLNNEESDETQHVTPKDKLQQHGLTMLSKSTATRCLNQLGYTYCERKNVIIIIIMKRKRM